MQSLSLLSSLMACNWDLVTLGLGGWKDLRTLLITALSSSASCWPSLVQTASIAMIYSRLGGCQGVTAKLGPLASTDLCAWVKGLLDKLMTHLGLGSSNELSMEDQGTALDAWASVLAWGAWDLTGEAGGGMLIAWVSAPAWALPGGDALTAWASALSA